MAALFREEIPAHHAVFVHIVVESDDFVVIRVQIRRILMRTGLLGFIGRQIMPVLAGELAAAAGRAPGRINKKCLRQNIAPSTGGDLAAPAQMVNQFR